MMRDFFAITACLGLAFLACCFYGWAYESLESALKIKRAQEVPIIALQPGNAVVQGRIQAKDGPNGTVKSFHFQRPCVGYWYTKTEHYRDAKGCARTRTVDSRQQVLPFFLAAERGRLLIQSPGFSSTVDTDSRENSRVGSFSHDEQRLEEGDAIFAYGQVTGDLASEQGEYTLGPDVDGLLRISTRSKGRLYGPDQFAAMGYGILGALCATLATGLLTPRVYRMLRPRSASV